MAKKNSSNKYSWYKIGGMLSFWAIIISGTLSILNLIVTKLGGSINLGFPIERIISIMLILGMFISGYVFLVTSNLPGTKLVWKIVYIVLMILLFVGLIGLPI